MSYGDKVEFLIVYIREAHPEQLREGSDKTQKTGVIGRPETLDERIILATECVAQFKFTIPMVIDPVLGQGSVNADYAAAPVRTTITDKDGKVAYYAGPGPFDFRIDKIERALKKIVANNGYMPPPPPTQWGAAVNGLRYGIAVDPANVKVGDDVLVMLKFENTTDKPINFLYQSTEAAQNLAITNQQGQSLTVQTAADGRSRMMGGRMRRVRPQRIAPGATYNVELEGKIVAAEEQAVATGKYTAVSQFELTEEALAQMQVQTPPDQPLWTGKLASGICLLDVGMTQAETCADCHGGSDYHHSDFQPNCEDCHTGRVGTEDFDVKTTSCSQCHPRSGEEVFGRRDVLGPVGEFSMVSKHIPGTIKDENCLMCHDLSQHLKGEVLLNNHNDGGKAVAADGANTAFCLSCHDGDPPAGVKFPEKAKGSGYDKSAFAMMGQTGCSTCHSSHGSTLPSLMKDIHGR